jgi:DNA repair protein SbcD/Mre11
MKFVLFSDLHLDAPFQWAPVSLGRRLRRGLRESLDRVCRLACEQGADALLCAGDLYEQENFTPETAQYLQAAFERIAPVKVFITPGNYDWYGPASLYEHVSWSPNVHIFTEARLMPVRLDDTCTLWGAAHRAPANTDNFLHDFHTEGPGSHVALFHGSERGFRAEQIPVAGLLGAFVGGHQSKDDKWVTYAGRPQPLAFGESPGKAVVIKVASGKISRTRADVSALALHDIDVDVSEATSMAQIVARARAAVATVTGVARVTLSGRLAPSVELRLDDIRAIPNELDEMVVSASGLVSEYDLHAFREEQTVRGQFVRDVEGSDLPDAQKRRVLTVGLRALDGRRDLEPV